MPAQRAPSDAGSDITARDTATERIGRRLDDAPGEEGTQSLEREPGDSEPQAVSGTRDSPVNE